MTLEEAIKTAIDYEIRVRDAYLDSIDDIKDETGKRVFRVLGKEEQGHIDYLASLLAQLKQSGKVSPSNLKSVVPVRKVIEAGVKNLDKHLSTRDYGTEREMLKKALAMEMETSDFYEKMVEELKEDGNLFARFLEIEKGHLAIVQAELDYLNRTGTFFDFQEFNMED
ncbi:MAG: ferritin family protein [candidate division Zixibacteria bacterium]|nr:ferritin family protein [candidate division Zixibacteria bacterium]